MVNREKREKQHWKNHKKQYIQVIFMETSRSNGVSKNIRDNSPSKTETVGKEKKGDLEKQSSGENQPPTLYASDA